MRKQTNEKGFTIIEVVLVLAIAGLIFLIVFLALPQLQRSRRDTQRRNDVGRVLAELENYAGNNDGDYPDSASDMEATDGFKDRYLAGIDFSEPSSGQTYEFRDYGAASEDWHMEYEVQAVCDGEDFDTGTGNDRDVAIRVQLEAGDVYYCSDNR